MRTFRIGVQLFILKPIVFGGLLVLTTIAACGGHAQTSPTSSNAQQSAGGWPEPDPLPSIEYTAQERGAPASVEDANATLKSIRSLYNAIPQPIGGSITREAAYNIAKGIALLQTQLPADIAWLENTQGLSIPDADKWTAQTFDNPKKTLLGSLQNQVPQSIERTLQSTRQSLQGTVDAQMDFIRRAADVDMSDEQSVRSLLSNELTNRSRDETIKLVGTAIEAHILLDNVVDGESTMLAARDDFRATLDRYRENLRKAMDAIYPPEDIGNAELTKIAEEVFSRGDKGLPEPERLIVNTGKRAHSEDHYAVDFGEREITKDPYRWEEFQVATIEKADGQFYLWYTTLLNYSVGPHTVPVGKWVVGPRHKSAQISEANIGN